MMSFNSNMVCGGRHESKIEGCNDNILSKDIINFEYNGRGFYLYAEKIENNKIKVVASGGNTQKRDGTYFRIVFESDDLELLNNIQKDIETYNVSIGNGNCVYVDGLPAGIGDRISVTYENGEKIYKTSNQFPTITDEAAKALYNTFKDYVVKHKMDFTSAGSNVQLYDDADEEYLQGTWNSKHFGDEISATFENYHIIITVNGNGTDDTEYTIFEGNVVKNKLKEGITEAKSYHDFEYFNGVSMFVKKNWFTMTGYFMQNSYSTSDFMNFNKEKPEDA